MNVNLEKINDTAGKLIVNVEEADYKQKVADELKKNRPHTYSARIPQRCRTQIHTRAPLRQRSDFRRDKPRSL